jgi:RNA polymerase sigma-70 factor (ECF subfamily)
MRRSDPRDDAALLAAAAHDPEAFAVFYSRYAEPVFAFLINRTRRADLAADLTAETFAAALAGARRFWRDAPTAAPWLFRIARNELLDSVRRKRVEDSARRKLGMQPIELDDGALASSRSGSIFRRRRPASRRRLPCFPTISVPRSSRA